MNARAGVVALLAAALLAACGTTRANVAPSADGTGTPAITPAVALSVSACEPGFWCVAAGANPATTTDTTTIETSAGGHGRWAAVAVPQLSGATLTAAGCWDSGCLLGGSDPSGTVLVIVNPKRRDASQLSTSLPGSGIGAIDCTRPGQCLALVTSTTQTSVYETTDSGTSWQLRSALPPELAVGTSLGCANSAVCVAVGTSPDGAAAARTTDGGARWTEAAVPRDLLALTSAACAPVTWCVATGRLDDGRSELLRSLNRGRSWASMPTSVANPDAVACTAARACVVAGGGAGGGEISTSTTPSLATRLTLAYVPDPVLAVACATPRKCVGVTQESTVSFVA